jgi:hypothetical protein
LNQRKALYENARSQHTRKWNRIHTVHLNPDHAETQNNSPQEVVNPDKIGALHQSTVFAGIRADRTGYSFCTCPTEKQPLALGIFFLGDLVNFESIGLTLSVEEIYDRVDNADMNEFRAGMN